MLSVSLHLLVERSASLHYPSWSLLPFRPCLSSNKPLHLAFPAATQLNVPVLVLYLRVIYYVSIIFCHSYFTPHAVSLFLQLIQLLFSSFFPVPTSFFISYSLHFFFLLIHISKPVRSLNHLSSYFHLNLYFRSPVMPCFGTWPVPTLLPLPRMTTPSVSLNFVSFPYSCFLLPYFLFKGRERGSVIEDINKSRIVVLILWMEGVEVCCFFSLFF